MIAHARDDGRRAAHDGVVARQLRRHTEEFKIADGCAVAQKFQLAADIARDAAGKQQKFVRRVVRDAHDDVVRAHVHGALCL